MFETDSLQPILQDQLHIPGKLLSSYTSYGLDEIELALILQLFYFFNKKDYFPTLTELASPLTISEKKCSELMRKLIQRGFLTIEQNENDDGKITEVYSLQPLLEMLYQKEEQQEPENNTGTIFVLFEQEFGRPLSPFEIEMINTWLDEDKITPAIIKAGLRESVLMGKLNFKYIDRILREWKKKGIHTVEEARRAGRKFHNHQRIVETETKPRKKRDTSIYYNWLEGDD
jgi:DNA replication protein